MRSDRITYSAKVGMRISEIASKYAAMVFVRRSRRPGPGRRAEVRLFQSELESVIARAIIAHLDEERRVWRDEIKALLADVRAQDVAL